ncbi:MAG: hypothetical protein AAFS10_09910, partial [Myxococcota bacterium]
MVEIDWANEAVAFLILDAKTNALSFERWDGSDGTLHFVWSGIEPAYGDATPGIIVRIPKRTVTFKEESDQA